MGLSKTSVTYTYNQDSRLELALYIAVRKANQKSDIPLLRSDDEKKNYFRYETARKL
jgi:hypothetical protein